MKNIGVIILSSLISAFAAVSIYSYFYDSKENAEPIIIKSSEPSVIYTNYTDDEEAKINEEKTPTTTSSPTNFTSAASKVRPGVVNICLLYTSPSPRDATLSRMPSSA